MAKAVSFVAPDFAKEQIVDALVAASFIMHSGGKAVLEYARVLFGNSAVDISVQEREEDEKMVGMNGSIGEGGACTSLARAYTLLLNFREEENAEELKKLALTRFLKDQFTGEVEKVRSGG